MRGPSIANIGGAQQDYLDEVLFITSTRNYKLGTIEYQTAIGS